jgi:hypothetical protein
MSHFKLLENSLLQYFHKKKFSNSYISYKEIVGRDTRLVSRLNFEIQIIVTPSIECCQEENTIQECLVLHHSWNLKIQSVLNRFPGRKKKDCLVCSKITKCKYWQR